MEYLKDFLKPGGVIIISVPNVRNLKVLIPLLLDGRWDYVSSGILDKTHLRFFTKITSIELLLHAGFEVDLITSHSVFTKGTKTWFFNKLTFNVFRDFFATQYLLRGRLL